MSLRALLLLSLLPVGAVAQPIDGEVSVRTLTFNSEEVEGGVQRPDAQPEMVRVGLRLPSLITVRRDFRPEMLQSAEDL